MADGRMDLVSFSAPLGGWVQGVESDGHTVSDIPIHFSRAGRGVWYIARHRARARSGLRDGA